MNDFVRNAKKINLPITKEMLGALHEGELLLLSGKMLVMRDAAHKKIFDLLKIGAPLPIEIKGGCIYYMAPCPPISGRVIGSCGPTTSKRMDAYAPLLYDEGLAVTVGKGGRNEWVYEAIKRNGGAYFVAIGGAGAYYADCVTDYKIVAYPELLSEAIAEIIVEDFPVICVKCGK